MMNINASKLAYNDFSFKFKTSSGDNISLSMYDKKQVEAEVFKGKNSSMQSYTLTHSFGYRFEYSGNGLDANDKKEIEKALEAIQPKIDKFMENVKNTGIPTPRSILQLSQEVKNDLPEAKTKATQDFTHDSLLKLFDSTLKKYFPDEDVLNSAKKLFDTINEQIKSFALYA